MIARLLCFVAALSLAAAPVSAQEPDELVRVLHAFAEFWERGDASGLVRMSATNGLELEVHGEDMGAMTGRRAAAALRRVFDARQTVSVRSTYPSRVSGAANRAFVEVTWVARPPGAPVRERSTLFIGFVQEDGEWRISEIRIMR